MSVKIHPSFKLNGIFFSKEELKEVGYSLVKEGEPYEQAIGDFLLDWLNDDPKVHIGTSGSTGAPKKIVLQKSNLVYSAKATGEYFLLNPGDSALHCLPSNYIAGIMMLVRAMILGLELDCVAPSARPIPPGTKSYDLCAMVPLQVEASLEELSRVRIMLIGGAPLSWELRQKVTNSATQVYETFGMTETISHIAVKRVDGTNANNFRTLPGIHVESDQRGCLLIHAPRIADMPIVTNDLVAILSKNEFQWLGRIDNLINSGGIKLMPESIEAKLTTLIKSRFILVGLPDQKLGQKLTLLLEDNVDPEKLLRQVKAVKGLDPYEIPREIHCIDKFVETGSGKVDRKKTAAILIG